MNKYMPRTARAIMLVAVIILILTTLSFQSVFADSETRANSATSFAGANFASRLTGDSYVTGLGSHAKVTLYLATTNDPSEISINMGNVAATRKDGKDMFVKFGESIFIKADKGTNLPTSAFVNKATNKYDTLVDYKKGEKNAPLYNSSTRIAPGDMIDKLDVPKWLKDDAKTTDQEAVVSWMMNSSNKYQNLYNLVFQVAEKSDPAKASGTNAVGNVLSTTLSKASFKYTDAGQLMTLSAKEVMPGENYAYWLVVYEPLVYYAQDPNKIFFPSKGGNAFLFSASDAVLANAKAGTSGYPVLAKFAAGTPGYTLKYNYCNLCGKTWYGYASGVPGLTMAAHCPPNCFAIPPTHYVGEKTKTVYPFAIPSAILSAARTFTVDEAWMKYSGGYLIDEPTGGIDNYIDSASDVDNILHYGGYSAFINGPIGNKDPTLNVQVAMLDEDGSFYEIPDAFVEISIVGHPQKLTQVLKTENFYSEIEDASEFFEKELDIRVIKPKYPKPINAYRLYMTQPEHLFQSLTDDEIKEFIAEIERDTGKEISKDDLDISPDGAMASYMDTDTLVSSTDDLDWENVMIFASEETNINTLDDINENIEKLYRPGEIWPKKNLYVTILIKAKIIPVVMENKNNTIKENELIKAMSGNIMSVVSLQKNCTDTNCDGKRYDPVGKLLNYNPFTGEYQPNTEWYSFPCGHSKTVSHAKNITPKSVTVQPGWYWGLPMFSDVSKLSALRGGSLSNNGVNFVFNQTGSFTSTNMSNVFDAVVGYKFMTHRNADPLNNGAVKPLQLAGYMNNTNLNKDFQNFITPYYGTYPSAYSNPNGFFGNNDFKLVTLMPLPSSVNAVGSGRFCSGGSRSNLSIPSKLTGSIVLGETDYSDETFKTQTEIIIKPTIASEDKRALNFATKKLYWGIGNEAPQYFIQVQSDTISFNPAYKMNYQTSNDGGSYKQAWILAAGKKDFISNDFVSVQLTKSNLGVTSPWSRDSEDKMDESSKIRTTPTAKSGSTIKAAANGSTVQVDVIYHIQDPNFAVPSQKANVQSKNDLKATQFDNMIISIADKFKADGVSFYSNMFQSTTAETLNKLASPSSFRDLTSKTTLKLAGSVKTNVGVRTKAYYLDTNGVADYTTNARAVVINGQSVSANTRWTDVSAVRSTKVLNDLLVKNYGVDVAGWYNEDYEGIIVVHKTYIITLSGLESTYAQIHPQHSDVLTERNKLAKPLKFVGGSETLIQDHFGIGVEYRLPTLNINGQSFSNIVIPSKPFMFDLRGSIYDTK